MKLFQNLSTNLAEEVIKCLFLFIALVACSTEWNGLSNFGRGSPKKASCIIISKFMHWLRRRSHLKVFSIFSSGGHLVQWSGTFEQFW